MIKFSLKLSIYKFVVLSIFCDSLLINVVILVLGCVLHYVWWNPAGGSLQNFQSFRRQQVRMSIFKDISKNEPLQKFKLYSYSLINLTYFFYISTAELIIKYKICTYFLNISKIIDFNCARIIWRQNKPPSWKSFSTNHEICFPLMMKIVFH